MKESHTQIFGVHYEAERSSQLAWQNFGKKFNKKIKIKM